MKTIYIVHGWGGSGSGGWFDWLKEELGKKGYKVIAFDMPDTDTPVIEKWVGFLKENVKELNEDVYFVGYSIGCQTILRYLESLKKGVKVGGCFFVAGWFNLIDSGEETEEDKKLAMPWIKTQIDFEKVKSHCSNFFAMFSSTDYYVPLTEEKLFQERIHAKTKVVDGKGHFEALEKIPEILKFIS